MELFNYLLKASCILVAGYLLYHFICRKFTFFAANRTLLVGIVIISMVMPVLHIRVYRALPSLPVPVQLINETKPFKEGEAPVHSTTGPHTQWSMYLQLCYLLVSAGLLTGTVYRVIKLLRMAHRSGKQHGKYRVVTGSGQPAASFFNLIFLDPSGIGPQEQTQILAHEQAHARLFHSADKLLLAFIKAILWFNPVVYLIEKSLAEVHEYQVDLLLIQEFEAKPYAQLILKMAIKKPRGASLVNTFAVLGVKGRLAMLFAPRSHNLKKLLYLSFLPVLASFLYTFTITPVSGKVIGRPFTLVLDAGHGGSQKGATGIGGVFEKDLNLQMVNAIAAEARSSGVKVVLTREHDATVALPERVKQTGDAFLSIHFNSTSQQGQSGAQGSEVLASGSSTASVKLGFLISRQLETVPGLNEGQKVKSYSSGRSSYVLRANKIPAVILEIGYLTNAHDLRYVSDQSHQKIIAAKIMEAVNAYRDK